MTFKDIILFSAITFCINNAFSQNVAREMENSVNWLNTDITKDPISTSHSISRYDFKGNLLPAFSNNFETKDRAVLTFFDLVYEPLGNYRNYIDRNLRNLKGTVDPVTYYTLEGNKIFTGYYICPFKESGGSYFRLVSYKIRVEKGTDFAGPQSPTSSSKRAASTSVLATGTWLKFSVSKDGLYKIDASKFSSAGIDIGSIDPKTIKLYTHQGGMLSEINADFRYDDLPENAIQVVGENDGQFNTSDFILFYAESPHKWKFKPSSQRFVHETNIYSDKTYVFVTFGGSAGKRMTQNSDGNSLTADASYSWFDYYELHEQDLENVCNEGRVFLGEKFYQKLVYNFSHNLPNIQQNKTLRIYFEGASISPTSSSLLLKMNNVNAYQMNFVALPDADYCYMDAGIGTGEITPTSSNLNLSFSYNQPVSSASAWLNYYELHCSRSITFSESFMGFRNIDSRLYNTVEYRLSSLPSSHMLFDVTDPINPKIQQTFTDNGQWIFRNQPIGIIRQFALSDGNIMNADFEGTVANQNLHATGIVQFIIVSHPDFVDAANKLAEWHRTRDNMDVKVVTPQQIYNEFSSGSQDISAIRDYLKHVYYSNTNPANQLKYAMIFGDASFDYKDKYANNTNFVPVFESEAKWNFPAIFTGYYCSDDFYGFLDSTDGAWKNEQKMEIAVSRLPVASSSEAMAMVDKIINYKAPASLGEWRNFISFCADDVDEGWETEFVRDFESIYRMIDTTYKNINVRKVYLDAFKQQNLGGSQRYPEAQQSIKKEFEQGTLIFNYIGHGGEEYLATEKVLDIPLITSMKNANSLPVFFTATCEFSRYDDLKHKSAGEYVITQEGGGAIAMFTTTRVVNSADNAALTSFFWNNCIFVKSSGKWPTVGDVYKKLKNWPGQNGNDRRFTLFADPAMVINYPEHIVKIDSINSAALNPSSDTMKALSKITFVGHVEDINGNKLNNFNGKVFPIVYDKPSNFKTLNNDNVDGAELPFELYSNILYKGQSSVVNGDYTFTFVVPKDINYTYGYGKISMYADNGSIDAGGNYRDIIIGGASSNASTDVTGPEIELFVDDYSFVSGGMTDNSPLLLARVFDENGINTSGIGIGRDIVAIIDKGTANEKRYVLNSFYTAKLNSFTSGDIKYQLEGLSEGTHTYTLKVWDVYNNSNEATIEFVIKNNDELRLDHVLNYPNPFSTNTTFHFDHNLAGENLSVVLTIMTISGKVMKTIQVDINNAPGHVAEITWNGRDDYDDKPSKGVYIYKITVSTEDGKKAEKFEKLVILN